MAESKPTALCIGGEQLSAFLAGTRPDWHFLPPVNSIQELYEGMDNGSITSDIHVLFIPDHYFDSKGNTQAFEQLVAYMSPHCFFGILNYHPELNETMKIKIDDECYKLSQDPSESVYHFIHKDHPEASLQQAVASYIKMGANPEVASILAGETYTPPTPAEEEEDYSYQEQAREKSIYLGQVTAVTSSKGGSGKSTVADLVATYLAHSSENSYKEGLEERPLKVIIVDLDVRDGQQGFLTGHSRPTVVNLHGAGISDEALRDTIIHDNRLKVDLILAPKKPRLSDDIPPEFYIELLQKLRTMYDYVILDTSVNYLDPLLEKVAYPMADQIIFVTDVVINSVYSMCRWITEVTKSKAQGGMGISRSKIAIVLNKTLDNVSMPKERLKESAMGLPVISAIPSSPKLITHAANLQQLDILLTHKEIYVAIRRIVRPIVADKYRLSDNVS